MKPSSAPQNLAKHLPCVQLVKSDIMRKISQQSPLMDARLHQTIGVSVQPELSALQAPDDGRPAQEQVKSVNGRSHDAHQHKRLVEGQTRSANTDSVESTGAQVFQQPRPASAQQQASSQESLELLEQQTQRMSQQCSSSSSHAPTVLGSTPHHAARKLKMQQVKPSTRLHKNDSTAINQNPSLQAHGLQLYMTMQTVSKTSNQSASLKHKQHIQSKDNPGRSRKSELSKDLKVVSLSEVQVAGLFDSMRDEPEMGTAMPTRAQSSLLTRKLEPTACFSLEMRRGQKTAPEARQSGNRTAMQKWKQAWGSSTVPVSYLPQHQARVLKRPATSCAASNAARSKNSQRTTKRTTLADEFDVNSFKIVKPKAEFKQWLNQQNNALKESTRQEQLSQSLAISPSPSSFNYNIECLAPSDFFSHEGRRNQRQQQLKSVDLTHLEGFRDVQLPKLIQTLGNDQAAAGLPTNYDFASTLGQELQLAQINRRQRKAYEDHRSGLSASDQSHQTQRQAESHKLQIQGNCVDTIVINYVCSADKPQSALNRSTLLRSVIAAGANSSAQCDQATLDDSFAADGLPSSHLERQHERVNARAMQEEDQICKLQLESVRQPDPDKLVQEKPSFEPHQLAIQKKTQTLKHQSQKDDAEVATRTIAPVAQDKRLRTDVRLKESYKKEAAVPQDSTKVLVHEILQTLKAEDLADFRDNPSQFVDCLLANLNVDLEHQGRASKAAISADTNHIDNHLDKCDNHFDRSPTALGEENTRTHNNDASLRLPDELDRGDQREDKVAPSTVRRAYTTKPRVPQVKHTSKTEGILLARQGKADEEVPRSLAVARSLIRVGSLRDYNKRASKTLHPLQNSKTRDLQKRLQNLTSFNTTFSHKTQVFPKTTNASEKKQPMLTTQTVTDLDKNGTSSLAVRNVNKSTGEEESQASLAPQKSMSLTSSRQQRVSSKFLNKKQADSARGSSTSKELFDGFNLFASIKTTAGARQIKSFKRGKIDKANFAVASESQDDEMGDKRRFAPKIDFNFALERTDHAKVLATKLDFVVYRDQAESIDETCRDLHTDCSKVLEQVVARFQHKLENDNEMQVQGAFPIARNRSEEWPERSVCFDDPCDRSETSPMVDQRTSSLFNEFFVENEGAGASSSFNLRKRTNGQVASKASASNKLGRRRMFADLKKSTQTIGNIGQVRLTFLKRSATIHNSQFEHEPIQPIVDTRPSGLNRKELERQRIEDKEEMQAFLRQVKSHSALEEHLLRNFVAPKVNRRFSVAVHRISRMSMACCTKEDYLKVPQPVSKPESYLTPNYQLSTSLKDAILSDQDEFRGAANHSSSSRSDLRLQLVELPLPDFIDKIMLPMQSYWSNFVLEQQQRDQFFFCNEELLQESDNFDMNEKKLSAFNEEVLASWGLQNQELILHDLKSMPKASPGSQLSLTSQELLADENGIITEEDLDELSLNTYTLDPSLKQHKLQSLKTAFASSLAKYIESPNKQMRQIDKRLGQMDQKLAQLDQSTLSRFKDQWMRKQYRQVRHVGRFSRAAQFDAGDKLNNRVRIINNVVQTSVDLGQTFYRLPLKRASIQYYLFHASPATYLRSRLYSAFEEKTLDSMWLHAYRRMQEVDSEMLILRKQNSRKRQKALKYQQNHPREAMDESL